MLRHLVFVPALMLVLLASARADDAAKEKLFVVSMEGGIEKSSIVAMNADGTGRTTIKTPDGIALDPALSPDGKSLAFTILDPKAGRADIMVAKPDGSDPKKIISAEEKEIVFGVSGSPDGKRLAYSVMKQPEGGPPKNIPLMICAADGKNAKQVGDGLMPAWSHDGKSVLYTTLQKEGDFEPRLHVMDIDGKNNKELLKGRAMMGTYSPDGKRIAYMAAKEGKNELPRIHVCNADGSEPKQVTGGEDHFEISPHWSADGQRIFFNRMKREGAPMKVGLFVMDADGKNEKRLNKEDGTDLLGGGPLFLLTRSAPAKAQQ